MAKAEVAQAIVNTVAGWLALSGVIEGRYMAAKKAIADAGTADEIKAASNVRWAVE